MYYLFIFRSYKSVKNSLPPKYHITGQAEEKRMCVFLLSQGCTYLSSEESGDETDNVESKILFRRPLPWLKKKYQKSLKELDHMGSSIQSAQSKRMTFKRQEGIPSNRPMPEGIPNEFIYSEDCGDHDTSVDSIS